MAGSGGAGGWRAEGPRELIRAAIPDPCVSATVGVASGVGVGREDNGIPLDYVRILDGAAAFYMTQRGVRLAEIRCVSWTRIVDKPHYYMQTTAGGAEGDPRFLARLTLGIGPLFCASITVGLRSTWRMHRVVATGADASRGSDASRLRQTAGWMTVLPTAQYACTTMRAGDGGQSNHGL